jgi:tetratricopeptide (TPR) repeat protein
MLRKQPEQRPESMEDVVRELETVRQALRRSGSRLGAASVRRAAKSASLSEEVRAKVAAHVQKGRAYYEARQYREALSEMQHALKLDPSAEEAAEVLWRCQQKVRQDTDPSGSDLRPR